MSTFTNLPKFAPFSTKIIGIYGIPGSGKTYLKARLEEDLDNTKFSFFEGSEVIDELTEGGLEVFKTLPLSEKHSIREQAIKCIHELCENSGKDGIVTGHFMFWKEHEQRPDSVLTQCDWDTYTSILYLDLPASRIAKRIEDDPIRKRDLCSSTHMANWQEEEKRALRRRCLDYGITLFAVSVEDDAVLHTVSRIIEDIRVQTGNYNNNRVAQKLDAYIDKIAPGVRHMMVFDGGKTLSVEDTGNVF